MALGRPVWTGHIRLSLVSLPVKLYAAVESTSKLSFRQIHEPTGKPVSYEKTVAGLGPIETSEIVKGYEIRKGEFVLLKPEEIEDIRLESSRTMELVQFIDVDEIDPLYFDRGYYVAPDGELSEEAYRVVRDALRNSGKAGLGQLTMRGREHLCALKPCGRGMELATLRYADEVRDAAPYFADVKDEEAEVDLLELAEQLIERKAKPFDPAAFHDSYAKALEELVQSRASGKAARLSVVDEGTSKGAEVIDLMAALKQSLGKEKKTATRKKKGAA